MGILKAVYTFLRAFLISRAASAAENLALRQQLAILKNSAKRPRLRARDRVFWVWFSRLWRHWQSCLILVKPETVVKWHRQGFRLYWRWKSLKGEVGRPKTEIEIQELIQRMCRENVGWGAPRIFSELELLGYSVGKTTVDKYMIRPPKPPSQTWRTFLHNHLDQTAAIDFFTVPTATFRILYCFLVIIHARRRVVHFNITDHPSADWTAQQIVEAFPYNESPRFLIRDRDSIYNGYFRRRVKNMNIEEVVISRRSPWQNPYVERLIGSIRRECLNHMIVLNEAHLKRILGSYFKYYHASRPHQSLNRNSPSPRKVEPRGNGKVVAIPQVGGLHHRYKRAA